MKYWGIVILAGYLVVDLILRKKFPKLKRPLELIGLVVLTVICVVYSAVLGYGMCQVLVSGVSTGDKVFFVLHFTVVIAVYVAMTGWSWKRWFREGKPKDE